MKTTHVKQQRNSITPNYIILAVSSMLFILAVLLPALGLYFEWLLSQFRGGILTTIIGIGILGVAGIGISATLLVRKMKKMARTRKND